MTVTVMNDRFSAKVLMVRSSPSFTSKLQQTLSKIYADNSTLNLGTLNRYKFVPVTSNTAMSETMLKGLLRTQSAFSRSVFVYTCQNIHNFEHTFTLTEESQFDSLDNDTTSTDTAQKEPHSYQYSLRDWFHDIEASDGTNLTHAVYSTNDPNTIRVLCENQKRYDVLEILHNLYLQVQQHFPAEAIQKYFPNYDTHTLLL